ncbi:MAG: type II toxin-antitoxin system Phd/YefM family antitoxin [Candidatus Aminicenantes bacterium]|nr:type II toxin-antitoxin system Phd/YefM family antitoxin [Candidatus Aminicenantes bacterium]
MDTVGVNYLRKNLTTFLRKVEKGESIVITSRGHEVALLVPPKKKMEKARRILEELRKTAFVGDVISPVTGDWEFRIGCKINKRLFQEVLCRHRD